MITSHCAIPCCRRLAKHFSGTARRCRRVLLSLLLSLYPFIAYSDSPTIWLLQSGEAPVYEQVTASILSSLDSICAECAAYQIKQLNLDDTPSDALSASGDSKPTLIVSIGVKAARFVASSQTPVPKLYTLIPYSSAASLNLDESSKNASAIYLDQPYIRQLKLIKLIKTEKQVLGVLFGPATSALRAMLKMAANNLKIPIATESVTEEAEVGQALRRILESSDILLALPDPLVYNRDTIFNILLSSYHSQIPVIGFSASYVNAGAMLAVFSTPSDIGIHIAETIRQFIISDGKGLPEAEFPRYFSVEVNRSVARSLDIDLPDSEELKQRLEQMEGQ